MYRFFIAPTIFIGITIINLVSTVFFFVLRTFIVVTEKTPHHSRLIVEKLSNLRIPAIKHTSLKFNIKIKLPKLKFTTFKKVKSKRKKIVQKQTRRVSFAKPAYFLLGLVFASFLYISLELYQWFSALPNPQKLVMSEPTKPTRILDRNGRLLYEIYLDKKYETTKLENVPSHTIMATLAIEDAEFFNHRGIRPLSMLRAAKETLFDENIQGGSTITQQLIKNVLLTPEQTISRKLKEAALALIVETQYSKEQILELYLNNVPYGGNAWGIQAASQKYFDKDVNELTLAESAMLAGLPPAPSEYSPLTDFDRAKQRQKFVLDKMVTLGYIDENARDVAFAEELSIKKQIEYIEAPHFVEYIRNQLEELYGKRFVDYGGLTIVTTLDLDIQRSAQEIVSTEVDKNIKLNITNGAAVVLGVEDSEILAYVGSVDYFRDDWGSFDVVTAYRQPGSSIKVVTYSLAFTQGMKPSTKIEDKPMVFNIKGSKPYKPVNYDGKFHGEITLKDALANSYNVPAVQLASKVGPANIVKLGREMGLKDWAADDSYGLSITLGGEEVRLLDLANVYATLARKGVYNDLSGIRYIEDSRGYKIYESKESVDKKVLDEQVTDYIWNILSDNKARLPAFGTRNSLTINNNKIAVKTGTTDEKRDNWTFGYNDSYVVGVWVGNNDNSPMNKNLASGLSGAAPIWNRIMTTMVQTTTVEKEDTAEKVSSLHKPEQIP